MSNIDAIRRLIAEMGKIPKPRYRVRTPDGQTFATDYPLPDELVLEDRGAR